MALSVDATKFFNIVNILIKKFQNIHYFCFINPFTAEWILCKQCFDKTSEIYFLLIKYRSGISGNIVSAFKNHHRNNSFLQFLYIKICLLCMQLIKTAFMILDITNTSKYFIQYNHRFYKWFFEGSGTRFEYVTKCT